MIRGVGRDDLKAYMKDHPGVRFLDFSQLTTFEMCGAKYNYIYGHSLPDPKHPSAIFSAEIVHPMLSDWYIKGGWGGLGAHDALLTKCWKNFQTAIQGRKLTRNQQATYTKGNAQMVISNYIQKYTPDLQLYKVVNSEEVYWGTLDGLKDFLWLSKPDLVLSRVDNALVVVDFKSSQYAFNNKLIPFDRQFLGQAYLTNAKFIMKRHIQLEHRITSEDAEEASINLVPTFLEVDSDLLTEWEAETVQSARDYLSAVEHNVWIKRAPTACNAFNQPCTFMDICTLGHTRDIMLKQAKKVNNMEYLGL